MKNLIGSVLLLLLMCAVLTGCGDLQEGQSSTDTKYHLYYISEDEMELREGNYQPADENPQAMLSELLKFLEEEDVGKGRLPLLPAGVKVNTHVIADKTLTLEFNKQYMKMSASREVLTRAGVVKLFAQLPDIEYVKFSIAGRDLMDSRGIPISIMNAQTFVEYSGESLNSYEYATITLYFTNAEGSRLIPEERTVYYDSNVPLERVVVEQLMRGPASEGLYPVIPPDFTILGVTTDEGNCYLNLDRTFVTNALPLQDAGVPIYAIVNSIADACQKSRVQISINGETNVAFRDSVPLNQFFEKNNELILQAEE